jgi:hypothetical protein
MQLSRFAILGALVLGAAGCRNDSMDATTPTIPPLAYIRYINAVPDTLNTTVRWIDEIQFVPQTFVNVAYRGLGQGNYQGIQIGAKKFRVFTSDVTTFSVEGNTAILVDTSITFEAGKYYTLLHTGYARAGSTPKQHIQVIEDVIPTPGTNIALRAINAGVGLATVDVYLLPTATSPIAGAPTIKALSPEQASTYATLTPAAFAARVTATGDLNPISSSAAPAGVAGNPAAPAANGLPAIAAVDPVAGATVAGSVMTAIAFPASVAGSKAVASASPTVVYFLDKQPPRYTP